MSTTTTITPVETGLAGRPCRIVLTSLTGWSRPADLGSDCLNVRFRYAGQVIPHWFEDTRRSRTAVWLKVPNHYVDGGAFEMVSGVSRPKRKPRPEDAGLLAGFNFNDPLTLAVERTPRQIVVPNTTPTNAPEPTFWNMVPRIWRMASGKIGMVCMGGASGETAATKYVIFAQSIDEGRTWTTPKLLVATPGSAAFASPSAAFARNGKDYVVMATGAIFEPKTGYYITVSDDDGATWGTPAPITGLDVCDTGGNNDGVQLSAVWGNKLLFSNHTTVGGFRCFANLCDPAVSLTAWTQHLLATDDALGSINPQEPAIVETRDGNLLALVRSKTGVLYEARTTEPGNPDSWTPLTATSIPNPNSKPALCKLSDGRLALICNLNGRNPAGTLGSRRDLTMALSADDGRTWTDYISMDGVQNRSAQYASAVENTYGGLTVVYAGLITAAAGHRTIFCQVLSRAEVNTPMGTFTTSGGGGHRTVTGWRRQFANEGMKFRPKLLDGATWPLFVSCRLKQMVDYPRENVIVVYQHSTSDTGDNLEWVGAIGGDANPNAWQWKLNPYKASYLTTGKTATINGEHELNMVFVSETEWYAIINGTRVPGGTAMRAPHDTGALPRQVVFGSPNYGSFPDTRGAVMSNGNYQDYICGVVVHNPAFVTGSAA